MQFPSCIFQNLMSFPSSQLALETHICVLWKLSSQNQLPPKLNENTISFYQQCFSNAGAIVSSVHGILKNNLAAIDAVLTNLTEFHNNLPDETSSTISGNIWQIPEDHLLFMHYMVATLRLLRWNPDILSTDPNSMYNILHEQLAIISGNTNLALAVFGCLWESLIVFANDWVHFGV